jgi:hypothetical protein
VIRDNLSVQTRQLDGRGLEPDTEIPIGSTGWRRYQVPGAGMTDHPSEAQMLARLDRSD